MGKIAVVAGGSGLVGKELLYQLIKDDAFEKIILILRRHLTISDPKIEQHIIDFDNPESYVEKCKGADVLFCCLGTTMKQAGSKEAFHKVDFQYCYNFALAGKQVGAKVFVLNSSMGADTNSKFFYNQVKGDIENKIDSLHFDKFIIARPSLLLGNRKEFRLGELIGTYLSKFINPLLIGSFKKYRAIEARQVAKTMRQSIAIPQNGTIILESDKLEKGIE